MENGVEEKKIRFFFHFPPFLQFFFSSSFFLHSEERGGISEVDQTSFFLGQCDFEIYVVPGIKRKRSISVELLTVQTARDEIGKIKAMLVWIFQ